MASGNIRLTVTVDASKALHDLWEAQWYILVGRPWARP